MKETKVQYELIKKRILELIVTKPDSNFTSRELTTELHTEFLLVVERSYVGKYLTELFDESVLKRPFEKRRQWAIVYEISDSKKLLDIFNSINVLDLKQIEKPIPKVDCKGCLDIKKVLTTSDYFELYNFSMTSGFGCENITLMTIAAILNFCQRQEVDVFYSAEIYERLPSFDSNNVIGKIHNLCNESGLGDFIVQHDPNVDSSLGIKYKLVNAPMDLDVFIDEGIIITREKGRELTMPIQDGLNGKTLNALEIGNGIISHVNKLQNDYENICSMYAKLKENNSVLSKELTKIKSDLIDKEFYMLKSDRDEEVEILVNKILELEKQVVPSVAQLLFKNNKGVIPGANV